METKKPAGSNRFV